MIRIWQDLLTHIPSLFISPKDTKKPKEKGRLNRSGRVTLQTTRLRASSTTTVVI